MLWLELVERNGYDLLCNGWCIAVMMLFLFVFLTCRMTDDGRSRISPRDAFSQTQPRNATKVVTVVHTQQMKPDATVPE